MKALIINHNTNPEKFAPLRDFFPEIECVVLKYDEFKIPDEKFDFVVLSGGPINISNKSDLIDEKKFLLNTNLPVFAICLGLEIYGVLYGSQLKDLSSKREGFYDFEIFGEKGELYYSQECYIEEISEEFEILRKTGNIIELMVHKQKPILAIQGHPEKSGIFGEKIRDLFIERFVRKYK